MNQQALLNMVNIHKRFSGVYALKNVSFELLSGEVHAILGENGAGKSTLIKVLGGIYNPDEGQIFIEGKKVDIANVLDAQKNGIAIIHQELVLAPYMSVAENIFLGREPKNKLGLIDRVKMNSEAAEMLKSYSMNISPETLIVNLSIAQRQMVEIIKAISYKSKILVMDEPTSSIAETEVEFLFKVMRNLALNGVGIIYISHKMSELNEICDRVTVLRDGEYVGTEVVKQTTKEHLISLMVGRTLTNYYTRDYVASDEVVLKCTNLSDGDMVQDANFELKRGEILGFAGLVGAGRSETMKILFGLTKKYSGTIELFGKQVKFRTATQAFNSGIALVPEDRKLEGLYLQQSVRFNATIEILRDFINGIIKKTHKEIEITDLYIKKMNTKTPSQMQIIRNLSGGNQQKVMIGRWLATNPKILILDEPTRGVDVGAKAEIYSIMNQLVKEGLSIIMISSELPEIINMSDRVYVMSNGVVKGCFDHSSVTQEKIMHLAAE